MKHMRYLWTALFAVCLGLAFGYSVSPLSVAAALWLGSMSAISLSAVNARVAVLESDLNTEQRKIREVLARHEELINKHEELINKHEELINKHEELINKHEELIKRNEELIELVRWRK